MKKVPYHYVRHCKALCNVTNFTKISHRSFYNYFTKADETSINRLKNIYKSKLLPLEKHYKYHDFYSPSLTDQDFNAKPMVLFVGQYSTGKTTMLKYLIEKDYPGIRIGPEPTTDKFMVVMGSDKEQYIPGNALIADPNKQFHDLSRFGNNFLKKLQCAMVDAPLLQSITFVDTPGILSGAQQRSQREYDFYETLNWFAERSDMIILTFDANKLDISDELKAAINILKAHDSKLKIVLNKADTIEERSFYKVYGALMWALGKTIDCAEIPRVYVGSFWDRPYKIDSYRNMFNEEENDLFQDIKSLSQYSIVSKLNQIGKRAKLAIVHAYIISELKKRMPLVSLFNTREELQSNLINNLEDVYHNIQVKHNRKHKLSSGDFPDIKQLKVLLKGKDFYSFNVLNTKLIDNAINLLDNLNIDITANDVEEVKSNIILNSVDNLSPFNVKTDGIHEGKFEQGWIVDYYRVPFDEIFNKLEKNNGKVVRTAAKEEFLKTKLPDSILSKIWKLADVDDDGLLDSDEFALAMYLIKIKSEGSEIPPTLPKHLIPVSKRINRIDSLSSSKQ